MENLLEDLVRSTGEQSLTILNVIVRQNGEVIARHDFEPEKPILLWSASKTFVAMAIGIAEKEGYFSIGDKLIDYLPSNDQPNNNLKNLRIRDLLCMGSGHHTCPVSSAMEKGESLDDIGSLFFAEPFIDTPGTRFKYDNSSTYMLSKLITQCTAASLLDYLVPRLFAPLGIAEPQWLADPAGISFGCSGLFLTASDLSKFGQCLLNLGNWQGKQLIPQAYVKEATRQQISTADFDEPFATPDYRSGYGYQLWMNHIPGTYRIDGLLGQYCIVLPQKNAVVTYTSNEPKKMTSIIELTWNTLIDRL